MRYGVSRGIYDLPRGLKATARKDVAFRFRLRPAFISRACLVFTMQALLVFVPQLVILSAWLSYLARLPTCDHLFERLWPCSSFPDAVHRRAPATSGVR